MRAPTVASEVRHLQRSRKTSRPQGNSLAAGVRLMLPSGRMPQAHRLPPCLHDLRIPYC